MATSGIQRAYPQLAPRVQCKMYVRFYNLSAEILITLLTLFYPEIKELDLTKHNILIGVTALSRTMATPLICATFCSQAIFS